MSLEQDQPYVERTLNGDLNAFTILMDRYKYMVFTLAMRMVKNREEAEEIAQDTFLKIYNGLEGFKGNSKFSTWVYKIAYYRSLDYLKKRGRGIDSTSIEMVTEKQVAEEEDIVKRLEQSERSKSIKDALQLLPGDDGILITLHYYEELSLFEIAQVMGISVNNVKVKLFRARKRLKQVLINKLEPEIISNYAKG
ncbi:MAG: RNA polymerase sigma factor [Maribacter sp.]|nr:RNA polymerase sigma factor [Maribacter sp.]MBT8314545.1 RNA polymerase sigma factor [Maribacter sp.]